MERRIGCMWQVAIILILAAMASANAAYEPEDRITVNLFFVNVPATTLDKLGIDKQLFAEPNSLTRWFLPELLVLTSDSKPVKAVFKPKFTAIVEEANICLSIPGQNDFLDLKAEMRATMLTYNVIDVNGCNAPILSDKSLYRRVSLETGKPVVLGGFFKNGYQVAVLTNGPSNYRGCRTISEAKDINTIAENYISKGQPNWLYKCITDFGIIKAGMTRKQIEFAFPRERGLHAPGRMTFVHPQCQWCKVDVDFIEPGERALSVSKPYIQQPYREDYRL